MGKFDCIINMTTSVSGRLNAILCIKFNNTAHPVISGILLRFANHILSLRGDVWSLKTSLTQPIFIEVPIPCQESEGLCICVSGK
jgi:hypothetical protein